jgi:hypothetical protein
MEHMAKYLIGAVALIIVLGGAYYAWEKMGSETSAPEPVVEESQVLTYASTTLGISLTYPKDFLVNEAYAYDQFGPNKLIHGVSFTIPGSMATGTNLSSDTYIAVETLPRARLCTGDIYLLANVRAEEMTEGTTAFSHASSTGAAAGNRYEEHVYALADSDPCVAIRYFIHSTSIENYEPGAVREFDRDALLGMFDTIRRSVVLGNTFGATTTTP